LVSFSYRPDNWDVSGNPDFIAKWIDAHEKASTEMNKPFHLEEFGKNTTNPFDPNADGQETKRRDTFNQVFSELTKSLENGNSFRAASYWMFDPILQSAQSNGFEDYGQDQVPIDSFTFKEIIVPAAKAATQVQGVVNGCQPGLVGPAGAGVPAGEVMAIPAGEMLNSMPAGEVMSAAPAGEQQVASAGRKLRMLDWTF
jgi:hypothetical protein